MKGLITVSFLVCLLFLNKPVHATALECRDKRTGLQAIYLKLFAESNEVSVWKFKLDWKLSAIESEQADATMRESPSGMEYLFEPFLMGRMILNRDDLALFNYSFYKCKIIKNLETEIAKRESQVKASQERRKANRKL